MIGWYSWGPPPCPCLYWPWAGVNNCKWWVQCRWDGGPKLNRLHISYSIHVPGWIIPLFSLKSRLYCSCSRFRHLQPASVRGRRTCLVHSKWERICDLPWFLVHNLAKSEEACGAWNMGTIIMVKVHGFVDILVESHGWGGLTILRKSHHTEL